jgi:hypothetical protein
MWFPAKLPALLSLDFLMTSFRSQEDYGRTQPPAILYDVTQDSGG